MSVSVSSPKPKNFLTRIHELKSWQKNQDRSLRKSEKTNGDAEDMPTTTLLHSTEGTKSFENKIDRTLTLVNDKGDVSNNYYERVLPSPPKTFEQILQEKLRAPACEISDQTSKPKVKYPFLRKGTGLKRYNLKPGKKVKFISKQLKNSTKCEKHVQDVTESSPQNCGPITFTPLKTPHLNMHFRGKWHRVDELPPALLNPENAVFTNPDENVSRNLPVNRGNQIVSQPVWAGTNAGNNWTSPGQKRLEKELRIFEMLEEKAENSSFCSTSSSVIQLLQSTPNKPSLQPSAGKLNEIADYENSVEKPRRVTFKHPESEEVNENLLRQIKSLLNCQTLSSLINPNIKKNLEQSFQAQLDKQQTVSSLINPSIKKNLEQSFRTQLDNQQINHLPDQTDKEEEFEIDNASGQESANKGESFVEDIDKRIIEMDDDDKWSTNTEESSENEGSSKRDSDADSTIRAVETRDVCTSTNDEDSKDVICQNCTEDVNRKIEELNEEIAAFRRDNAAVQQLRKKLQEEETKFEKQMKALRREFEDERRRLTFALEEEKAKLAKEKMVFERYVKDSQNRPSRKEREEISNLKIEVASLKETIKLKETKNGTTQARLRTQVKQLEKENETLKQELDKMRKENGKLVASQKLNSQKHIDSKVINEINKSLSKFAKEVLCQQKTKDCTYRDERKKSRISEALVEENEGEECVKPCEGKTHINRRKHNDSRREASDSPGDTFADGSLSLGDGASFKAYTMKDVEENYEKLFGRSCFNEDKLKQETIVDSGKFDKAETVNPDGSREIRYGNGHVKTISPDGNYITMRYNNGDTKEIRLLEGIVRYRYHETKACHTSLPDGTEVLEFPNSGHKETKHPDGLHEIETPDGKRQTFRVDGSQELNFPEGTRIEVSADKTSKVIHLPNGQKEIHTLTEKRREYPDGTVKILYNDGRQETRYSNGRIRIRDREGVLVVDTFQDCGSLT